VASSSLSIPSTQTRSHTRVRLTYRTPPVQIVIAVFVALLILLLWMHLMLAAQIESTGREIQVGNGKLEKLERGNAALRQQISVAGSQQNMAQRAEELGFEAVQPIYIVLPGALPEPVDAEAAYPSVEESAGGDNLSLPETPSFLSVVAHTFDIPLEANAAP
jgi:cell division protein FtsB